MSIFVSLMQVLIGHHSRELKVHMHDLLMRLLDAYCRYINFVVIPSSCLLLLIIINSLKLYLLTLTPSAIADFQGGGGRDSKKKTIYINTNKDSKTQVRC